MYSDLISNIRTVKLLNDNNYFIKKVNNEGKKSYNEIRNMLNIIHVRKHYEIH